MATLLAPPETEAPPIGPPGGGGHGDDPGRGGFGGGDFGDAGGEAPGWSPPPSIYLTGIWVALASVVMFFAAITSIVVVRSGMAAHWTRTAIPRILDLNTLVLVASSATLEVSRRALTARRGGTFAGFLWLTLALGAAFLAGQLEAWRELAARGVYLASNPSSSFFYLITAAHGIHLLGGIIALAYAALPAGAIRKGWKPRTAVDAAAVYWHFMDGLWIYLFLLMVTRL